MNRKQTVVVIMGIALLIFILGLFILDLKKINIQIYKTKVDLDSITAFHEELKNTYRQDVNLRRQREINFPGSLDDSRNRAEEFYRAIVQKRTALSIVYSLSVLILLNSCALLVYYNRDKKERGL